MDLRGAAELHRSGRLAEAESAYRQLLAANPADANACNLRACCSTSAGNCARRWSCSAASNDDET